MRKNRFSLVPAALALASALMLSACSGSTTAETTAAASEAAESAAEAADTADSDAADAAESESSAASVNTLDVDTLNIINALDSIHPEKPENLGEVKLGEYKSLELTTTERQIITDEDVEEYIETNILPGYPIEVYDEVQDGDTATINYVGSIDGVEFEGGSADNYPLVIGSGTFIPGFEDGLIGAHYGETVKVNVTFPEDYSNEELAGKDALFVCDVNKIERPRTLDQMDDEFVSEITEGEYETLAAFKDYIQNGLQTYSDAADKEALSYDAITAAMKNSEVKPTDEAVEWQKDIYIQSYNKALANAYGMSLATLIQMYGQTYEEFRAGLDEGAQESAARAALIYKIAEEEGLEVTDEAIAEYAAEFGYDNVETLRDNTSESELELAVISNLVTNVIVDNANITIVDDAAADAE